MISKKLFKVFLLSFYPFFQLYVSFHIVTFFFPTPKYQLIFCWIKLASKSFFKGVRFFDLTHVTIRTTAPMTHEIQSTMSAIMGPSSVLSFPSSLELLLSSPKSPRCLAGLHFPLTKTEKFADLLIRAQSRLFQSRFSHLRPTYLDSGMLVRAFPLR